METAEFDRLKSDFLRTRFERWAAIICSIVVALSYLLLLVLLYLFVDLLVSRGMVGQYSQLNPARQSAFAAEWERRSEAERTEAIQRLTDNADIVKRLAAGKPEPAPTMGEWEQRWRAGIYLSLRECVNPEAAETFLPNGSTLADDQAQRVGVLALVARERNRWPGKIVGWVASWNSWMWRTTGPDGANVRYLTGLFLLAFVIAVVRGLLVAALAYLASVVTLDIVTRIRRALYLHTYRLGSLAIRTAGPEEPINLFTKQTDAVGDAVRASLVTSYRSPVLVIGLLVLILVVNFWLAVSFLLLAFLVWLIGGQVAAHFRREARLGTRQSESSLALLVESLGLLRLVKCYQMERFNQNRVERQLAELGRSGWRKLRGDALSRPLLGAVALIAGVALCYLAGRAVLAEEFSVAGLVAMAVALVALLPPIADWFNAQRKLRRGREAAAAITEFLARRGDAAEAVDAEYLPALTSRLEFRAVRVEDPGTGETILENVSFAVPAGARVAIVGPDLLQRRALIDLIPRFIDPNSGEVRIEDKNIRWVTHESLRAQVASVRQDDWIFTDTVANNIGCGDPQYNLPQIIEAAKLAHAHQFIEKLPYGYETVVGEHGKSLKLGERFRLALARALLRDPSILIVEEPSGPVDEDTLALLDDTLERASSGRTIIFLANRLSTLRSSDRVFLLRDGHLEASGTHRDLWQNNEYYRRLQMVADATAEATTIKE